MFTCILDLKIIKLFYTTFIILLINLLYNQDESYACFYAYFISLEAYYFHFKL